MEIRIHNFRGLMNFLWRPQMGRVNVLIGANGSGKSAVCSALDFLTWAWRTSPTSAALDAFTKKGGLRLQEGTSTAHMGFATKNVQWGVTISAKNALRAVGACSVDGQKVKAQDVLDDYYDLFPLAYQSGSFQGITAGRLYSRLPWLLQNMMRDDKKKEFVEAGLTAAFPKLFEELVRDASGEVRVRERGSLAPSRLTEVSSGIIQLLGVLSAVAYTPNGGTVVFDDPTLSLHPYAVKVMFARVEEWASEHEITVLMMTHSEVLLNECAGSPDRVYMMKRYEQRCPTALTDVYDQDWLQGFSLGDLYQNDNIGSNADEEANEWLNPEAQATRENGFDVDWFPKIDDSA